MSRRRNGNVRSEHRVVAHVYMRMVNRSKIEIRVNVIAEMTMPAAEIRLKRRLYITIFAYFGKRFPKHIAAFL